MPCVEWFNEQDASYQEEVLPAAVRARVSVEAGITAPWKQFVGDAGETVGVDHYGASAAYRAVRGVRADGGAGRRRRQGILSRPRSSEAYQAQRRHTTEGSIDHELTFCESLPRKVCRSGWTTSTVTGCAPATCRHAHQGLLGAGRDVEPDDLRPRARHGDAYDEQISGPRSAASRWKRRRG